METYSEIVYYINEENFVIKYHKGEIPFCWVYIDSVSPDYPEYQEWLDAGNTPIPIVGVPTEETE